MLSDAAAMCYTTVCDLTNFRSETKAFLFFSHCLSHLVMSHLFNL